MFAYANPFICPLKNILTCALNATFTLCTENMTNENNYWLDWVNSSQIEWTASVILQIWKLNSKVQTTFTSFANNQSFSYYLIFVEAFTNTKLNSRG